MATLKGYIQVPRTLLRVCKSNDERGALLYLLMLADNKQRSAIITLRTLAMELNWTVSKVRRFLKKIDGQGLYIGRSENNETTISDTPTDTPTDTPSDTPSDTPNLQGDNKLEGVCDTPTDTPTDTPSDTPCDTPSTGNTDIKSRKQRFYDSLVPYVNKYGKAMVREFFDYWTEPNKSHTRMRFEQQRTWDTNLRLARWANNNIDRGQQSKGITSNIESAMNLQHKPNMYDNDKW